MNKKWIGQLYRRITGNLVYSIQGFIKDDCFTKAALLTFYTLLSIVPILAVTFGIAKGFGFENYLQSMVQNSIEQEDISEKLIVYSKNALEQANGGIIASAGVLFLLWTSHQLLSKIELSLNEIWGVKYQRSYVRQFSDYLAIIILCPIFFVLSSSFSIYANAQIQEIANQFEIVKIVSPYILFLLKCTALVLNWILFSFIYLFLPNTTINWRYAMLGGVIGGTLYQVIGWAYFHFQIGVSNYSTIYGSLAALPLFLIWVNLSWQVVLLGAEIAYHFEISAPSGEGIQQMVTKKYLGLMLCSYFCSLFLKGKNSEPLSKVAKNFAADESILRSIALDLFEAGILAMDQEGRFLPAKNPIELKMKTVLDALEDQPVLYPVGFSFYTEDYETVLSQYNESIVKQDKNLTLKEISEKIKELPSTE